MNKIIKLVISIVLNILIISAATYIIYRAGTEAFIFGAKVFDEQPIDTVMEEREVEVTVPENVTPKELGTILHDKGLIEDENVFYVQVLLSDYKDKFRAGVYMLKTTMPPTQIMKIICAEPEE